MRMWKMHAVRPVLVFVVVSSILTYARVPSAMCDLQVLLGTDYPRCVRRLQYYEKNRSYKHRLQQRLYKIY